MTLYLIQVRDPAGKFHNAPAPKFTSMSEALISAELWFPTETVQVVPSK